MIGNQLVEIPVLTAWFGAICFSFQIYFDFSGYSDMVIGLRKNVWISFSQKTFNYPIPQKHYRIFGEMVYISRDLV